MTTAAQNSKQILAQKGTAATPSFSFLGGNATGMYLAGTNQLGFSTAGTFAALIDSSGNVGIGTSSPAVKLHVSSSSAAAYVVSRVENTSSTGYASLDLFVGSSGANGQSSINYAPGIFFALGPVANDTTTPVVFRNNNATERMRIDTSGNVGIGTSSPSSYAGAYDKVLTVFNTDQNTTIGARYQTGVAQLGFINSGTASNAAAIPLAFMTGGVEKARIESNGNVGIGTSSPTAGGKLDVNGFAYFGVSDKLKLYSNNVLQTAGTLDIGTIGSYALIFDTVNTERMRIDSSGNVGIGTSAITYKLQVGTHNGYNDQLSVYNDGTFSTGGVNIFNYYNNTTNICGIKFASVSATTGAILFQTNSGSGPTERARIDSSGNLLVGTTSVSAKINVVGSGDASYFETTGTTTTCSYWRVGSNTACYYSLFQNASGSNIGWIRTTDGSTVQYYTGSDERLKENIKAAPAALSKLADLKVRSYNWKATGVRVDYGFIAQELVQTIPDAVSVGRDKEDGSIDVPWGVDYAKLVPVLVAACQELSAKNDALEARLAALEGK